MKRTSLLTALLALVVLALPVTPAVAQPPEPETELGNKMDELNRAFRQLKKQVADPAANASSLELVAKIIKASDASAAFDPAKTADLPEADRAKFVAAYKAKMKVFGEKLAKLEAALKAGKNDEAAAVVDELGAFQKESHKEFRKQKKS